MLRNPIKESIIEILNNITTLDDKTLEEVHNILKVDPLHIGLLSEHLKKLEFEEHYSLAKKICTLDQTGVNATLIRRTIEEKDLPRQTRFNLIHLCRSKGIAVGKDVLTYLLHFKPESKTLVGKGEALLRILMKGTPISTGDFGASGKRFEVKFNKSRLRGQTGFDLNDASSVATALDKYFIGLCQKSSAAELIGDEPRRWNFVSGKRIKPYLLSVIVKRFGIPPHYACRIFVQAFMRYFSRSTDHEAIKLIDSLSVEFNPDGSIKEIYGYSDFIYKMCAFAMKYYAKVENFDGMLILNDEFECMYITKEFIVSNGLEILSKFIRDNLKITPPNLTSKAGVQGSSFGISLL